MITVQNNASAIILLSIRYYESIMNSQLGTKGCIMKEIKIICFKFDEKNNLDYKNFQRLASVHHCNFSEPSGLLHGLQTLRNHNLLILYFVYCE